MKTKLLVAFLIITAISFGQNNKTSIPYSLKRSFPAITNGSVDLNDIVGDGDIIDLSAFDDNGRPLYIPCNNERPNLKKIFSGPKSTLFLQVNNLIGKSCVTLTITNDRGIVSSLTFAPFSESELIKLNNVALITASIKARSSREAETAETKGTVDIWF